MRVSYVHFRNCIPYQAHKLNIGNGSVPEVFAYTLIAGHGMKFAAPYIYCTLRVEGKS